MQATTNQREVEIDTKLAELWGAADTLHERIASDKWSLAHALGIRPTYVTRNRKVFYLPGTYQEATTAELVALVEAKHAAETTDAWWTRDAQATIDKYKDHVAALAANREEAKPLEDIYAAEQWSRFFLVQNHGGHIHKDMSCSTCRPTTRFGWLPTLSGLTEKDAVDAHGPLLCSVCFPSAPVEWTIGHQQDETDKCPGSGQYAKDRPHGRRYHDCHECGENVSVTTTGKLRAHKKAEVA